MISEERLREIRRVKERVEDELLQRPGVVGVDIGYKEVDGRRTDQLAIRVLVEQKRDVPADQRVPSTIEDVTTDVIQRGKIVPMADTTRYDPLLGGCSVGVCDPDPFNPPGPSAGTLGVLVRDRATGDIMALSNWHVLVMRAPSSDVVQPSLLDTGHCTADIIGQVARSTINDVVDCAVATLTARDRQQQILNIGWVRGWDGTMIGNRVKKRGRTTGLTYGDVDTVDATVTIAYPDGARTLRRQVGIWRADGVSDVFLRPGDSGSAVVDWNYRVVGLAFAGSAGNPFLPDGAYAWANPMADVLDAMQVDVWVPPKTKEKEKEKEKDVGEKLAPIPEGKAAAQEKIAVEAQLLGSVGSAREAGLAGPMAERLAELEATVEELRHFIRPADRPEVGTGAPTDRSEGAPGGAESTR
jgi:hypothetical protein